MPLIFMPGQLIRFKSEKRPYKVRACNERFVICTKPFNLKRTVTYTIVDLKKKVRGTENLVFTPSYESDTECLAALERLTKRDSEVSVRNYVELDIVGVSK